MAHPVITFPQPPPTSNTLTSHQRQHLLRSTRKLTKLLGSAPHLTDCEETFPTVYLDLSSKLQFVSRSPSLSRRSCDVPRPPSPASSISSVSTIASKTHRRTRLYSLSETLASQDALDSPFAKKRPPILRLTSPDEDVSDSLCSETELDADSEPSAVLDVESPRVSFASDLGSIAALLSPLSTPIAPILPLMPRSYTLPIPPRKAIPSPFIDTSEPTFKVTSEAATRRLKMERVQKRLGEGVPVEAVFPHEPPDDGDEDGDCVEVTAEKPTRVNVDLRPRWKPSSTFVTFDVIYECPDEHGDEGLANGLRPASKTSKNSIPTSPRNSHAAPRRPVGKLIKKSRRDASF